MLYNLPNGQKITHPALVAALAKPGAAILATLTTGKADAWHMASCIPGECGELFTPLKDHMNGAPLDRDNLIEELGDIEFYVQGLRANIGIEEHEAMTFGARGDVLSFLSLPERSADVFDAVKKWVIYNKALDRGAVVTALQRLDAILGAIRVTFDILPEEVKAANVWKLGARYSELTYSDAAAQQRADKTVH